MATFLIGRHPFKTKRAAAARVRGILHAATIDTPLVGADADLIASLYQMHPRKTGEPIHFQVGTNNYHGALTRGFQAHLTTGEVIRWSYIPALSPATDEPSFTRAARAAIMLSQREALRVAYNGRALIPCSACGSGVEFSAAHVHHMPPKFRDILEAFVALLGLPAVQTAELGDDFLDPGIRRRWILFHDAVAHRTVLCAKCNAEDERQDRL